MGTKSLHESDRYDSEALEFSAIMPRVFVYGIGNPGRQDDGLGPLLAERLEGWVESEGLSDIKIDANYQLMAEDAHTVSEHDLVIFADASKEDISSYAVSRVEATGNIGFSTHSMTAESVVGLTLELYGTPPPVYMVHIKGYEWEYAAEMTEQALQNLNQVELFIKDWLKNPVEIQTPITV